MSATLLRCGAGVVLTASMLIAARGLAAPEFFIIPDGPDSYDTVPQAVSADGTTIVGDMYPGGQKQAFRYRLGGQAEYLGALPGMGHSEAWAVNADGRVIVGMSGNRAFRWVEGVGMQDLGTPAGAIRAPAKGVSADGGVVCGWVWQFPTTRGFRWTEVDGLQYLPAIDDSNINSEALGVSADGRFILGRSPASDGVYRASRWEGVGPPLNIGMFPLGAFGSAHTASADGSIVLGMSFSDEYYSRGFLWSEASGIVPLPMFPVFESSEAFAMSGDGSVVVGATTLEPYVSVATMWTGPLGAVNLNEYFPSVGIDLTNWVLQEARCISADGAVIVGRGRHVASSREWYATGLNTTPSPCLGDGNGDRTVDFGDLTTALGNWGQTYVFPFGPGDCDGNLMVNWDDVQIVLSHFGEMCE